MKFKSLKVKLIAISTLLLLIPLLVIGTLSFRASRSNLDELGKTNLRNSVEMTRQMIDALDAEVEDGQLSLEEAQERVRVALLGEMQPDGTRPINEKLDLGENGYIYILDDSGLAVAHPFLEGENLWESQDPNGVYSSQEQIERGNAGGGFTFFEWPMPNDETQIEPKVVYTERDPEWGWNINAGTYQMDFNQSADALLRTVFLISVITLVIGLAAAWFFANSISKPILLASKKMNDLSKGDLTGEQATVKSNDEAGLLMHSMNEMQNNVREIIRNISSASGLVNEQSEELTRAATEVSSGTEQISATMEELASGAERQASHSSQLSATMTNFDQRMQDTNTYGNNILSSSNKALELTSEGQELMRKSAEQMGHINRIVKSSVEDVLKLDTKSQEISHLVTVIKEIAEQTNLLALNASIEAARAGEQGKGFAVVAEEVGKLAEQVAASVNGITEIVESIQNESRDVTQSLEEGYQEVEAGTAQVQLTQAKFDSIQAAIQEVANGITIISENLSEIADDSHEMNGTVQEIAAIAEESAAGIEETSAAAEETTSSMQEVSGNSEQLAQLAEQLNTLVLRFQV